MQIFDQSTFWTPSSVFILRFEFKDEYEFRK